MLDSHLISIQVFYLIYSTTILELFDLSFNELELDEKKYSDNLDEALKKVTVKGGEYLKLANLLKNMIHFDYKKRSTLGKYSLNQLL